MLVIFAKLIIVLYFNGLHYTNQLPKAQTMRDRKPVVSGKFYPSDTRELTKMLSKFFSEYPYSDGYNIIAVISPHAGYVFSGNVAASAFSKINPDAEFDNVFVIAPSHHVAFNGASIYNIGNYITPLGKVEVNFETANELIEKGNYFGFYPDAHKYEHSLEVQLPFLQYHLKKPFKIVPIVVGTQDINILKSISKQLEPWVNKNNLFVISSDFSHFPDYKGAVESDGRMAKAIETKSVGSILHAVDENKKSNISNLATSACGLSGIIILTQMIEHNNDIKIKKILYENSGDTPYGDKDRVVGYLSFIAYRKISEEFLLSKKDKQQLLTIARGAIYSSLFDKRKDNNPNKSELSDILKSNCGVFVTLHKNNKLRGCIGRFNPDIPLYKLVAQMAKASAFNDTRFMPVTADEFNDIEIEISILSPLKKNLSPDEIEIGKHGIYIKQGFNSGTLLPQVAVENNWGVKTFLEYCSQYKAGIGKNGWKTAELYIYSAKVFSE
jgi:AmmeMemoRadiSam system protein B/AmmeMemoRadiSam system protein A